MALWKKDNPDTPEPKPEDLAVPFFKSYSKSFPGTFPSIVEHKMADGKSEKKVEPVREGTDIQAAFFDIWLQEDLWLHKRAPDKHPLADLENVPADMVMAFGPGLDPHTTLQSAEYQVDRMAGKWAETTKKDKAVVRQEIDELLRQKAGAPLGGLAGVTMINVLEVNLALKEHYGGPARARASK